MKKILFVMAVSVLFIFPVNAFASTGESEEAFIDNLNLLDDSFSMLEEIEADVNESNRAVMGEVVDKVKLKIAERSQLVGNVKATRTQVEQLKENKAAIFSEVARIRSSEVNMTEEQLAALIKETKFTIVQLKDNEYHAGQVGKETVKLVKYVSQKDLLSIKKQVQAVIYAQNNRIMMLEELSDELYVLLNILQEIK